MPDAAATASERAGEYTGLRAIVTGAAGGIGSVLAGALAGRGAIVYGLDIAPASETPPNGVHPLACDVTDPESVASAVRIAAGESDTLDLLVLAAGRFPNRPLQEWTLGQFEQLWRLNVGGVFTVVQAAAPCLRRSRGGRVVIVSSSAVHQSVPGFAPYVATKAALIGFARSIAAELAPDGVTVNVVTPGLTATAAALTGDVAPFFDSVVQSQLIRRRLEAADLIGGILYLCSQGASMVTGQVLNIDGGAVTY
jgi:NAD(P)-dependent dehydrogenase (short-subunit alcohol dehydrogenase family)